MKKSMMFVAAFLLCIALVGVSLFFISNADRSSREKFIERQKIAEQTIQERQNQYYVDMLRFTRIGYIKDPRTGFCFSVFPAGGYNNSNYDFEKVPCDSIPNGLLIVVSRVGE